MSIDKCYLNYTALGIVLGGDFIRTRIKDLREDHDLTQQAVASAIGITQRKYSYIETGTQPLNDELLVKLSQFYGVSIDYILLQTNIPKRYKKS